MTYYARAELLGLWDEAQGELSAAIEDFYFARSMLRRLGEEEHKRFSEAGWAWGDMTWTGGSPVEVFDGQLSSVLETLGWKLSGEFYHQYIDDEPLSEEGSPLADLLRPDGGPLTEEDYAPEGEYTEDVLIAEIRGAWAELARLRSGLRRVCPDLRFYRHRPGSERAEKLLPGGTFYVILPGEMGAWQDIVHDKLFEWLIKEWEVRHAKRAPKARPQDRDRARALRRRHNLRRGRALRRAPHKAAPAPARARDRLEGRCHPEGRRLRGSPQRPGPLRGGHRVGEGAYEDAQDSRLAHRRRLARRRGAPLRRLLRRLGRLPAL